MSSWTIAPTQLRTKRGHSMVIKQYAIRNREGNYLHIESTINAITGIDEFDPELIEDGPLDFFENVTMFSLDTARNVKKEVDRLCYNGEDVAEVVCIAYRWPPKITIVKK